MNNFKEIAQLFGNIGGNAESLKGSDCRSVASLAENLSRARHAPIAAVRRHMHAIVSSLNTAAGQCAKNRGAAAAAYLYDALKSVGSILNSPSAAGIGGFKIPPLSGKLEVGFWFAKLQDVLTSLPRTAGTVSIDLTTRQYGGSGPAPDCSSLVRIRSELRAAPPPDYVSITNTWNSILANLANEAQACASDRSGPAATAADRITAAAFQLVREVRQIS